MILVSDNDGLNSDSDGVYCTNCGFWIHAVSIIYCEGCDTHICERCGKLDDATGLFLCPGCFDVPGI